MKMRSFYLILLIAASFLAACSSTSELTKQKWTLTVSTGGGFTGISNGFTMIETGEVFAWSGREGDNEKTNKIGSISVRKAHHFKEDLRAILDTVHVNSPGDVSTSVKLEQNKQIQAITWGSSDYPNIPDGLKGWYDDFIATCKELQGK